MARTKKDLVAIALTALVVLVLLVALRCATMQGPAATARLEPRSGSGASGTVTFTELADGSVRVKADLTGISPGVHGLHVHEKGDCSAPDASSAGEHFNPTSAPHGPHAMTSHAGDFGNVSADDRGEIHTRFTTRSVTLGQGERSVLGRAVVLHADPDDLTTQPSGNAGERIACGVVSVPMQ